MTTQTGNPWKVIVPLLVLLAVAGYVFIPDVLAKGGPMDRRMPDPFDDGEIHEVQLIVSWDQSDNPAQPWRTQSIAYEVGSEFGESAIQEENPWVHVTTATRGTRITLSSVQSDRGPVYCEILVDDIAEEIDFIEEPSGCYVEYQIP